MIGTATPSDSPSRAWIVALVGGAGIAGLAAATGPGVLAAAGLSALIAMLVLVRQPSIAIYLFVFIVYLNVPAILVRFHGLPVLIGGAVLGLLLIPIAARLVGRQPIAVGPALPAMLAYLLALALSALVSGAQASSLDIVLLFVAEGLVIYLLVTAAISSSAQLRGALWAMVIAATVMGTLSVMQELTGAYQNDFFGFAQVEGIPEIGDRPRLAGPIGEKNRYAQVLIMALPIAVMLGVGVRSRVTQLLAAATSAAILAGIVLTFSRGAAIGLVALAVAAAFLRVVSWRRMAMFGVMALVIVAAVAPAFITRIDTLRGVEGLLSEESVAEPDGAIVGRLTSNLAAMHTFVEHPLLGVGPGQYFERYSAVAANELGLRYFETSRRAHNLWLEVAADTGIAGLVTFSAILVVTVAGLVRVRRRWQYANPAHAALVAGLLLSIVAYLVTGMFLHLSYQRYFWLLIALASVAVIVLTRDESRRA